MINKLTFSLPFIGGDGKLLPSVFPWASRVSERTSIYTGSGSPEGVVEAPQFSLYLDTAAASGSIEYRKMLSDIGGDKTQGWKLL